MQDHPQPKITIIGSSLAGLTLTLSLLYQQVAKPADILILETRPPKAKPGGPVTLAPNSLRILHRLGIYNQIHAKGYSFDRITFRDAEGQFKGEAVAGSVHEFGYQALRIERGVVLEVLEAEVIKAGVTIEYDCSLREVVEERQDSVIFRVRRGGKDGAVETMTAGMLVGADGLHSRTRTWVLGKEVELIYNGQTMVVAKARRDRLRFVRGFEAVKESDEYAMGVSTAKGTVIMIPQGYDGTTVLFALQFPLAERDRADWDALNNDKQQLVRMLTQDKHEWPEFVTSLLEQAEEHEAYIWPIYSLPKLERYVSAGARSVIIGDAAHTLIPAAGQGANQAFEDAWTLAPVLLKGDAAALDVWQKERIERVALVAQLSLRLLNSRLPPEVQAKLPKDQVFDLTAGQGTLDSLRWLFGDGSTK